jgi:hypothetical protein
MEGTKMFKMLKLSFKKTWVGQFIRAARIVSKRGERDNRWLKKTHPETWLANYIRTGFNHD